MRHRLAERLDRARHEVTAAVGTQATDAPRVAGRDLVDAQDGRFQVVQRRAGTFEEDIAPTGQADVTRASL